MFKFANFESTFGKQKPPEEYAAIMLYTSNAIYKDLNQALRDNNRSKVKKCPLGFGKSAWLRGKGKWMEEGGRPIVSVMWRTVSSQFFSFNPNLVRCMIWYDMVWYDMIWFWYWCCIALRCLGCLLFHYTFLFWFQSLIRSCWSKVSRLKQTSTFCEAVRLRVFNSRCARGRGFSFREPSDTKRTENRHTAYRIPLPRLTETGQKWRPFPSNLSVFVGLVVNQKRLRGS